MSASDRSDATQVEREAAFGKLPVTREERVWSFADFTWVNIGLAIATWAFLIGGLTAVFLPAKEGIAAILIGNVIAVTLMALATCTPSAKYGVEQYTVLRSVLGLLGTRGIVFFFIALIEMGWVAVLAIMFGRSSTYVLNETTGTSAGPNSLVVSIFGLMAIFVSWLVLARGPVSIRWLNRIVAPGLAVVTVVMLVLIFSGTSWAEITAASPLEPFDGRHLNFMIAVEFNLAAGFSWWPVMGSLARLTRTQKAAVYPNLVGLFAAACLGEIVGLFAALSLGSDDPTVWMIPLGGAVLGVIALLFIALANVTSIVAISYSTCLAIRQTGGRAISGLRWDVLTGLFFLLPSIAVFFPGSIYDNFFIFLAWTSVAFAPLTGIYLIDFFWLRRRRINVRALYDESPGSPYSFWAEINPVAVVAFALGSITYVLMMNPQTLETNPLFLYLSASIPSLLVAAGVHAAGTIVVNRRMGKGAYDGAASGSGTPSSSSAADTAKAIARRKERSCATWNTRHSPESGRTSPGSSM